MRAAPINTSRHRHGGDLDGQWDDDLSDIVHFTEAGNERVADAIFRQLVPILAERDGLRCVLR